MPGFIKDVWRSGQDFFINLGINFLTKMVDRAIPDSEVVEAGEKLGRMITDRAKKALGDQWNGIENVLEDHIWLFLDGVKKGLDYDDK